jgi:Mechanosensitive ion channel
MWESSSLYAVRPDGRRQLESSADLYPGPYSQKDSLRHHHHFLRCLGADAVRGGARPGHECSGIGRSSRHRHRFCRPRTIANLFAGFQLALTQPIRIDDVVIVQNEWGRIEEITLTYVVVRIWDLRRLIVPLSYFIEHPFQNWTWQQADILGTVFIYTDYTILVEAVREELKRIVAQSNDRDGKVCVLQVTNTTERSLELRALASASDASKAWNLRCEIRERLVAFVQKNYPSSLPRVRAELQSDGQVIGENRF